jgi:hypothetical protein
VQPFAGRRGCRAFRKSSAGAPKGAARQSPTRGASQPYPPDDAVSRDRIVVDHTRFRGAEFGAAGIDNKDY